MRNGLFGFCAFLALAWVTLLVVTLIAMHSMGAGAAGPLFIGDFANPWRAQFNADFGLHLLLIAAWMIYRARTWAGGLVCGALAVLMGGIFTLAFILAVTYRAKGDMAFVFTGRATAVSPG